MTDVKSLYDIGFEHGYAKAKAVVKHGRWETPIGYPNVLLCSECVTPYEKKEFVATPNYCPNCGAKMGE